MKKLIYSTEKVLNKVNSVMEVFTGYVIFAFMVLLFFQVVMRFVFKHLKCYTNVVTVVANKI